MAIDTCATDLSIYLLSFAFTGIYWLNHQHLVRRVERASHSMQIANLGFLFCLSLLPLSTAYVVEKQLSGFAVAMYAVSLLIVALSFMWLRLAVRGHLNRSNALLDEDRKGLRDHLFSVAFYAGSIIAAFFYPRITLIAIALLTFFWVIPNLSFRGEGAVVNGGSALPNFVEQYLEGNVCTQLRSPEWAWRFWEFV